MITYISNVLFISIKLFTDVKMYHKRVFCFVFFFIILTDFMIGTAAISNIIFKYSLTYSLRCLLVFWPHVKAKCAIFLFLSWSDTLCIVYQYGKINYLFNDWYSSSTMCSDAFNKIDLQNPTVLLMFMDVLYTSGWI